MNLVKNCNIGNHIKTLAIVPKSQHHGFLFPLQMKRLCMEKVHSYRKRVTFCAKIIEQLVRPTDGRVLGKRGNRMHETNRTLTLWRTARATISHTHQYRSTNFQPGCSCSIAFLRFSSSFSVARQKWYYFRKPTIGKRPFFSWPSRRLSAMREWLIEPPTVVNHGPKIGLPLGKLLRTDLRN